ncbi:hypothetical protein [Candidatus Galacturonibacter soehngenii]|uniref:Uncharacterized protein n=1 Tax=Candidatus Galacturonatibacter soehngenii TaxID=2307010 RepID=A0A7V7QIK6_9FIRM|nr:hypothetical protein [Candidatus Galacturonibacter soehngenii]KAB1435924.1 hypothetical protein F7O84_16240 [Candidatus Galacturonibacter soehngenii]
MKKSSKGNIFLVGFICITLSFSFDVSAQSTPERALNSTIKEGFLIFPNDGIDTDNKIYPHAAIIGWRYKSVDGQMYRRQYNYSREKWIGEWELC